MATAPADRPLTDEELKDLSTWATQEDVDALTDEEAQRLERLVSPPEPAPEPAERKFTQAQPVGPAASSAPRIEGGLDISELIRRASIQADAPLSRKPSLAEFEASKAPPPVKPGFPDAVMTLPSYGTKFGADAPALPGREPEGFRDFGKMLGEAAQRGTEVRGPEPAPEPGYAAETSMESKDAATERGRKYYDSLLARGSLENIATGNVPYTSQAARAMIPKVLPKILEDQIQSLSEFAFHPLQQAARSPMEFGGNLAFAVNGLTALRKLGTAAVKEVAAFEDAVKAASPQQLEAYAASAEKNLDQAAMLKDQMRVLGASEDDMQRVRSVEERITELQATVEEVKAVKAAKVPKKAKAPKPVAPPVEAPVVPATAPEIGATSKIKVTQALSAAPMGGIILAGAAKDDETEPGAPRSGSSPLSLKSALFSAALGYGVFRLFKDPAFRQAMLEFMQISKANPPSLEKVFETFLVPLLPDTPANGLGQWLVDPLTKKLKWVTPPVAAGAGLGAYVGSEHGRDDVKPVMGALGLVAGAMGGGLVGSAFARQFKTSMTYRDLYRRWFTEAAGMSQSALAAKRATMMSLDGRIQEIKDTAELVAKFDDPTQAVMHSWMAGDVGLAAVPQEARWAAAKTRLIFDELTLDLLSSGLIKNDVLRDKLTSNLGTYLPRLFLRYEMGEKPTAVVQAWLTSQGKGWGYLSTQEYLKKKGVIPPDVLVALGEIKDRPGYLLGKRGVLTATDVEMSRYHRFLLSSPENSIPEPVLTKGLASRNAYDRLRYEDHLANRARYATDQHNVGELTEPNYLPDILREQRAQAEAKFATVEVPVVPNEERFFVPKIDFKTATKAEKQDYNAARKAAKEAFDAATPEEQAAYRAGREAAGRAKAHNARAEKTMDQAYDYLNPDTSLPKFMKAENNVDAAIWQGRTYWKMPDNPRYGLLKNQYVERAVAEDLMGMHEVASAMTKALTVPVSLFKFSKAVWNPASQLRNMASNAIFADILGGVSPFRVDKWGKAAKELASTGKWYQAARRDGVFGGGFTPTEIEATLYPSLTSNGGLAASTEYFFGQGGKNIPVTPAFYTRWHQNSEAHARLTVYMNAVQNKGMNGPQAAAFARSVIPDYRDVPRWLKVYRSNLFGAPFISFSYKALPRMFESAFALGNPKQMLRFWKYPLAMAAANEYSANTLGHLGSEEGRDAASVAWRMFVRTATLGIGNPDSYDTYRKFLPGHVGDMQVLHPYRDAYDRPRYFDATYILPWGDISESGKGVLGRQLGDWFPRQMEPANPWAQMFVAGMTGKDTFTGKDIVEPGQDPMSAGLAYVARAFGPSLFNPAGYGAQNINRAFQQGPVQDPHVKSPMDAIVGDIGAVRTRPVDPSEAYALQVVPEYLKGVSDRKRNIARLARLNVNDPDAEISQATLDALRKSKPGEKILRALDDLEKFAKDFRDKYHGGDPIPKSPQKLLDAIKAFQEREKK